MLRRSTLKLGAAKEAFDYCVAHTNPGVGRSHSLVLDSGKGSYVWDIEGKKYLDFACGIGVTNLGHCHPRLVDAVKTQVDKAWHLQVSLGPSTAMHKLLQDLEKIFPPQLNNFHFTVTGAEAVEAAMKLSRVATGRGNTVALQGAYHGRTVGATSITSSKYVYARNMRPLMPGVSVIPIPYWSQMGVAPTASQDELIDQALEQMEYLLHQTTHPSEVSMIIAEPTLGEGGYVPLPKRYYQGLRKFCSKHGILLVADEVQTGFGRTGTLFNFEQLVDRDASGNFVTEQLPDCIIFAKGIANGLPLAGIVTRQELAAKQLPGQQGGTYSANPIACACASEVIKIMTDKGFFENIRERSKQLTEGLKKIVEKKNVPMQEIRGRGLMIGMQFEKSCPAGTAAAVAKEANDNGLIMLPTSLYETVRLIPPLNVTKDECDEALAILEKALAVAKSEGSRRTSTAWKACCEGKAQCYGEFGPCRHIAVPK